MITEEKDTKIKGTLTSITKPLITLKKRLVCVKYLRKNFHENPKATVTLYQTKKRNSSIAGFQCHAIQNRSK